MLEVFLQTLPFFLLVGLGYGAAASRFFPAEASAAVTRFVFWFALPAMLFRFSARLSLAEILDWWLVAAYLWASLLVYGLATLVALLRRLDMATAAVEAQCAVIGNVGFLGLPMFASVFGEAAIGPNILVLAVDLVVFSSLIVILITLAREGRAGLGVVVTLGKGILKNPMIVAIALGLAWSAQPVPLPRVGEDFVSILGAAATPCALFAIGASLAERSAERISIAVWLSFCKLVLHPSFVALSMLFIFPVSRFDAGVVIALAALPVAGNIYILAQHYGVAPQRVSAAILVSTALSVLTVSAVIALVAPLTRAGP